MMTYSRELRAAERDVVDACTHYLLQASIHAARTTHRWQQVIGCVGRRQLAPDATRNTLSEVAAARGDHTATTSTVLIAQFLATLAEASFLPQAREIPPHYDPADPRIWIDAMRQHMLDRVALAIDEYRQGLARVASGEITPLELRRHIASSSNTRTADQLAHTARAWFELMRGIDQLVSDDANAALERVLRHVRPVGFDGDVIELTGQIGDVASTNFMLENTRADRVTVRYVADEVRRADGVGPAFDPDITFTPSHLTLDAGAQASVDVAVHLDGSRYEAPMPYIGTLRITRDDQWRQDVPLQITVSRGL
jgi:hypothetical protein